MGRPTAEVGSEENERSPRTTAWALGILLFATSLIVLAWLGSSSVGPTNYRSEVLGVSPGSPGVEFSIAGGDAYFVAVAEPTHTVAVAGYFSEPYVRINRDNSVWVNVNSPAYFINLDRYGETSIPADVTAESAPVWESVGEDGSYTWHDHRSHWMSEDLPPVVAGDVETTVFPWEVPLVVDDVDTTVRGELVWLPSRSPIAPILIGIIALLPVALLGPRRLATTMILIGTASVAAVVVTFARQAGIPVSARSFPAEMLLPVGAIILAATMVTKREVRHIANLAGLAAVVLLAAWSLMAVSALWLPVLTSTLPPLFERSAVAFVAWAGAGLLGLRALHAAETARP